MLRMSASSILPEPTAAGRAAAAELRRMVRGEVRTSPLSRWLYSTDSSSYRLVPDAVLVAGSADDLQAAAEVAARHGLPLAIRGGGTSTAGQAIGRGILVDCFRLDAILHIDPERRVARVQPGVIQASLNRAAAPYGLEFGPDTSTVDQATIGGMAGNNSSGSRSIIYGETVDKMVSVQAVLAGGERMRFGACTGPDLRTGMSGPAADRLAAELEAIRARSAERIAGGYPQTRRCTSGYNLRGAAGSRSRICPGCSPGQRVRSRCTPSSRSCWSAPGAARGRRADLCHPARRPGGQRRHPAPPVRPPSSSSTSSRCAAPPTSSNFRRVQPLVTGDEQAMLTVEYQGSEEEARAGLGRLRAIHGELGVRRTMYLEDADSLGRGVLAPVGPAAADGRSRRGAPGGVRRGHRGRARAPVGLR